MDDWKNLRIESDTVEGIVSACNRVVVGLPESVRNRLILIRTQCLIYGVDNMFSKLQGRTVGQILGEWSQKVEFAPVEKGTVDGIHFGLYDNRDD